MISILIPSRGRPALLKRMVDSVRSTAREKVEIVCRIDHDDPAYNGYSELAGRGVIDKLLVGKRIVMSDLWNDCSRVATGEIQLLAGDDAIFRTPGWDEMVEAFFTASADKLWMVHGDDLGAAGKTFGTHPIIHRRWIEALGRFTAPYFSCDYADTWLNDIANILGRRRFLPFVNEHVHWSCGKAQVDRTMQENLDRARRDRPGILYAKLAPERQAEAEKLRALIIHPLWSILVLTQPSRADFLKRLRLCLDPQVQGHPEIEVLIWPFNPDLPLGENRERMRELAAGEYLSTIDDDDLVAPDYVERILPLLDGVDQVAFNVQQFTDGVRICPTYVSLAYKGWVNHPDKMCRDILHLCPMRRELALQVAMEGPPGEDSRWSDRMRALGIVKTEHVIDADLYFYYLRTGKTDSPGTMGAPPWVPPLRRVLETVKAIPIASPVKALKPIQPMTPLIPSNGNGHCRACGSSCVIPSNGQLVCNQCQHQEAMTR
jgi:glycosyltransferase involved in cell wall biosynthesis